MATDTFDNWARVPREVFVPLTTELRDGYLAVLASFHAAVFEPAVNLEVLSTRLRTTAPALAADDNDLRQTTRKLVEWGLLEESRDDSVTYRDPAEFARRHTQWSLTHVGQATLAALDAAYDTLRRSASLQPAAIDAIATALGDVADWLEGDIDPEIAAQVHLRLFDAEQHHRSLVDNLRTFTRDVARILGRPDIDDDDLTEAKHRIIGYLDRYVVGTESPARRVSAALDRLEKIGFDYVASIATDGANLAPGLDGIDPAVAARTVRRDHLDGLRAWFDTNTGHALFAQLLPRGRDAVLAFLRVLGIRREVSRRNASLPEDFRALARAFNAASNDTDAHRLWGAATGMTPARHHHLAADDTTTTGSRGNPAHRNPPADVTVELRRRPRSTGRPSHGRPVPDRRAERAAAQAEAARELLETAAVRRALVTDGTVRISTFGHLDRVRFDALFELVGEALATACDNAGYRTTYSSDGHVRVTVGPPGDTHAATNEATIETVDGTLRLPDMTIDVSVVSAAGSERDSDVWQVGS